MFLQRLLITGASGNLGFSLSRLAAARYSVQGTYLHQAETGGCSPVQIDLRNRRAVDTLFAGFHPDAVIHTARSDRSPDKAETVLECAHNVAEAASASACRLIALSSDVVFDGTKAPSPEEALSRPTHDDRRVMAEAEQKILRTYPTGVCVRTSLIYDFDRRNRQLGWMLGQIARGKKLRLLPDEFRQPIWSWNLATALLDLVETDYSGILNIAGSKRLSRFEFGNQLLEAVRLVPNVYVEAARATEVAPNWPLDGTIIVDWVRSLLLVRLPTIRKAVAAHRNYS